MLKTLNKHVEVQAVKEGERKIGKLFVPASATDGEDLILGKVITIGDGAPVGLGAQVWYPRGAGFKHGTTVVLPPEAVIGIEKEGA